MCTIAIDTCVFEHLMNPQCNTDAHIDALLGYLQLSNYRLLVDETTKIAGEYITKIIPIIKNNDERKATVLPLLRHWMSVEIRESIPVDGSDSLMRHIKQIITEKGEAVDRVFVYVACKKGTTLVTNDQVHILDRHRALLRRPRDFRRGNPQIQSSKDAAATLCKQGGQV